MNTNYKTKKLKPGCVNTSSVLIFNRHSLKSPFSVFFTVLKGVIGGNDRSYMNDSLMITQS